ncbi:hypothetical protein [Roseitranquillus sediminis]|uniref:hypothetical protein n=1 Tax=Roseitranquillus sediminis TaxID=2809051 RepID=UPI001D0CBC2A|nr:hypothetical protein [Roseitranquillus sediminis]MBM9593624.1 hypothetical protein [Roseitranquillus sediminis]
MTKALLVFALVVASLGSAVQAQDIYDRTQLPPFLQSTIIFPGFLAIWHHAPEKARPGEVTVDAFHALQAIADHPAQCLGQNAETVRYTTQIDTVTRDGFGIERDRETMVAESGLDVRPEFAPWVRENIRSINSNPLSGVREGVWNLIDAAGCHSDEFRQLEEGLALAFGVTLVEPEVPQMAEADWRAFVATCQPAQVRAMAARGYNVGERGMALVCVCTEHAAQLAGDAALYEKLRIADPSAWETVPPGFQETFDSCYHEREPAEVVARYESFIRENGL